MSVLQGGFLQPALGAYLLMDTFQVLRRTENVPDTGVAQQPPPTDPISVIGVVGPSSPGDLRRLDDYDIAQKCVTIVTTFRLQGPSPGFMPDQVIWHGNTYVVRDIQDYSAYGGGFVSAIAQMVDALPMPPAPFVAAPLTAEC